MITITYYVLILNMCSNQIPGTVFQNSVDSCVDKFYHFFPFSSDLFENLQKCSKIRNDFVLD